MPADIIRDLAHTFREFMVDWRRLTSGQHADFQNVGESPQAIFFSKLPGRPLPNLHYGA